MIVHVFLSKEEEKKLLKVLRKCKRAIKWTIINIKAILMEEIFKPIVNHQRRLNPYMQDVVKVEVLKFLKVGIIYLISNNL